MKDTPDTTVGLGRLVGLPDFLFSWAGPGEIVFGGIDVCITGDTKGHKAKRK